MSKPKPISAKLRNSILENAKTWFVDEFVNSHKANTAKLSKASEFNINPFLAPYLATFYDGSVSAESLAKALFLPRALGTSVTTTFGNAIQKFVSKVIKTAFGSTTQGIDIEFTDCIDGRKKFCQVKLGPNTINKDDIKTIDDHFSAVKRLGRTNHVAVTDMVVGVVYGSVDQLSNQYKTLRDKHHYPIYTGREFWHRLTGDPGFYDALIAAIASVAKSQDCRTLVNTTLNALAGDKQIVDIASSFKKISQ